MPLRYPNSFHLCVHYLNSMHLLKTLWLQQAGVGRRRAFGHVVGFLFVALVGDLRVSELQLDLHKQSLIYRVLS